MPQSLPRRQRDREVAGKIIISCCREAKNRKNIRAGLEAGVVEKHNQGSGELTRGIVAEILTNSSFHPHGIKVRLETGEVGRVQIIH